MQHIEQFVLPIVAAAFLAGCGGSGSPIGANVNPQGGASASRAQIDGPRMLPTSTSEDLLYVAELHKISVFSYPDGRRVGELHLRYDTYGLCSDPNGDIFVAAGEKILEYAHGGTTPIRTLKSKFGIALQCAFDPTSGNLAVVSTINTGPEAVVIYQSVTGKAKSYEDYGPFYNIDDCAYDGNGNLFVTGTPAVRRPHSGALGELPKGAGAFVNYDLRLKSKYSLLVAIQWDGTYVTVQESPPDRHGALLDRIAIADGKAKVASRTKLAGSHIAFKSLYSGAAIGIEGQSRNDIGFWPYPAGGAPLQVLRGYGKDFDAATISVAPSR